MREFFLIDIAVPRDVEVGVENIENVYLFNIDDLKQVVDTSLELRRSEITRAQGIVTQGVAEFLQWWRSLEVTPLIVAIRGRLDGLRADEMARVRSKSPHLDEDDLRSIDLALQSYENKIAHSAIQAIKSSAGRSDGDGRADLDTIRRAFGLIDDFRENPK
jgi:glutamyl-tRNA reductase